MRLKYCWATKIETSLPRAVDDPAHRLGSNGEKMRAVLLPARACRSGARALLGDKGASLHQYEEFFASWKAADADIPILREAKGEYAELKGN